MGTFSFCIHLFSGILFVTIGSALETSSDLSILDSITSLKQMVLHLQDKMSSFESSIPQTLQEANEQLLITVLDEIELKLENYASTNKVLQMGEAVKKELQVLQSNHSLRMEQMEEGVAQMNQSLGNLISTLSRQLEDVQNTCIGEPPFPRNGKPVNFERKHGSEVLYECENYFSMTGNTTVRCLYGKWEGQPPVCSYFDTTFILRAQEDTNGCVVNITCSSEINNREILFSRLRDTGSGSDLPRGARTYWLGKTAVLELSDVACRAKRGVYQCGYQREETRTEISFVIGQFGWFYRPEVVSIGGTVNLGVGLEYNQYRKWLHNDEPVPAGDGEGNLVVRDVKATDAGIYERYWVGDRRNNQEFHRLVVRGCRANMFGESCDQECPTCYNGGTCHDLFGTCICPPGFKGSNCEVACGESRFGPNCSESCHGDDCKRKTFCKPDPSGCSCAAGYQKYQCTSACDEGGFGADCDQTCHCAKGSCDPYTGACSGGCSPGWTGQSCQIQAEN